MTRLSVVIFIGFLGLTACNASEAQPLASEPAQDEATMMEATAVEQNLDTITDPDIQEARIPVRFHGVWDYENGTCARESDLRVEIGPREIRFYESIGLVSGIGQDGDDARPFLVMEGEGEQWMQDTRLSLVDTPEGERLFISDAEKPEQARELPRKRCAS
ncbi:MAG: hypothetical protein AAFY42_06060 [Pseudomonadota bacterium]